ncbi:Metallophosphoesterase domain-containing protein 1 [Hypsizygus marmoreus]|uniref:Metallophosphoesterase domain-containing protein 1 n=1 Tax=Hypsizygus marmoreus TaxID=39966 RepID=A0A369J3G4_HYPMA|nr:Metallophosphoesterase domain-containing protein 1 [Hypsizygus marmoreus]
MPHHNFIITPHSIHTPTAIVHTEYDPTTLDPVPSPAWTRFVCISDTHARSFDVPPGDVLLHSGDLTSRGTVAEFRKTVDWLCGLPHKVKIIIAGNHDITLHEGWYDKNPLRWHRDVGKQDRAAILQLLKGPRAVASGLVYLESEEHVFQVKDGGRTWSVYGSPWSPYFCNWAFNYKPEDGPALIAKFPKTDILLTHGPAHHILDRTNHGDLPGCPALRARLPDLRPRIHVAGHIHEGRGAYVHAWTGTGGEGEGRGEGEGKEGEGEAPRVQNDNWYRDSDSDSDLDEDDEDEGDGEEDEHADEAEDEGEREGENELGVTPLPHPPPPTPVDRTVFVNAATFPSGRHAWRGVRVKGLHACHGVLVEDREERMKVPFGGPGFQAVVVDLLD